MTGGMAFVYDPDEVLDERLNPDSVISLRVATEHWETLLTSLIKEHVTETQSRFAERLLIEWHRERGKFWQIVPKEMVGRLPYPLTDKVEEQWA